jgi:hypothetical protein
MLFCDLLFLLHFRLLYRVLITSKRRPHWQPGRRHHERSGAAGAGAAGSKLEGGGLQAVI